MLTNDDARDAWFKYKKESESTTRPAKSVVDFVAGFNAGVEAARKEQDYLDEINKEREKFS